MQETCQSLEQERRQHRELRRSLQKSNLLSTPQNLMVPSYVAKLQNKSCIQKFVIGWQQRRLKGLPY